MQLVGGRGTPTPNVYVHSRYLYIVCHIINNNINTICHIF